MKKYIKTALCLSLTILAAVLSACSIFQKPSTASFQAMDTVMSLTVYGGEADICRDLQSRINRLDSLLDATDENSEIYRLNNEKTAVLSEDTARILRASLDLCGELDGSFDITVYPAVKTWGFTTGDYRVPNENELSQLASRVDHTAVAQDGDTFSLPEGAMIDLGAAAKGYAADVCTDILKDSSADGAVLNLGGTICLYGQKSGGRFQVGIADPENPAGYFGTLSCGACVISTSGGYERFFELDGRRYIHILDPKTAAPVGNEILSVTVCVRPDTDSLPGTRADALSTALFVMGIDEATDYYLQHKDFDFVILTKDGRLYLTGGIYDDFSLSDGYTFTLYKI